ncbi:MAG: CHAP domain-containing protein [Alphaproteobacteria bacterium]|nr:CHAP domain-containing protein [Alphaproteobacteria bacterium]
MLRLTKPFLPFCLFILVLTGCATGSYSAGPYAKFYRVPHPIQCVPYARKVSGIPIMGNAHTWWAQAGQLHYQRGSRPQNGAVLVLSQGNKLRYGHLAVVKRVIGPREIDVTHSNWGNDRTSRSLVYEFMRVRDVSPRNDWTQLRFWNGKSFGSVYPAYGFIYK